MFDLSNVALLGEVMLELAPNSDGGYNLGVAGDTYNAAIVLSRLGVSTEFVTSLGGDHYSRYILSDFSRHGIGRTDVVSVPDRLPGLYIIDNDDDGSRHFSYWRTESAAKYAFTNERLFKCCLDAIASKSAVYWSGVTLALLNDKTREMMFSFLAAFRQGGGHVFFDSNYRKALWSSSSKTLDYYTQAIRSCDVYMTSYDDEHQITGCLNRHLMLEQLRAFDECNVVLSMGAEAIWLNKGTKTVIDLELPESVIDTTGGGDSFHASLIAALSRGQTMQNAVGFAQSVHNRVMAVHGATLSESAWADVMRSFFQTAATQKIELVSSRLKQG